MKFKVIQVIRSRESGNPDCDVQFYLGDNKVEALAALVTAAAAEDTPHYIILSSYMEVMR